MWSALAEHAVSHGLSLAKSLGAKVTALIVEAPFNVFNVPESRIRQMSEAYAQHAEETEKHATRVLERVADAAKAAGVSCQTVQLEHDQPYKAIITTARQGLRRYRHGLARAERDFRDFARERN